MKILMVHNHYLMPGGEDAVFASEAGLLRRMGHDVVEFVEDNRLIDGQSRFKTAVQALWHHDMQRRIRTLLRESRADVAHFHNIFLRISPAAYYACREAAVPVVQTAHNYRLFCPSSTHFFRNGQTCEDCYGRILPWPAILHRCYRASLPETTVLSSVIALHRWLGTWQRKVDIYIALTNFARDKFIAGGFPPEKIVVKPNSVEDPLSHSRRRRKNGPYVGQGHSYCIFVGALRREKGVLTLLRAWRLLNGRLPLKVAGDGPLMPVVKRIVQSPGMENVEVLGQRSRSQVLDLMKAARFLIFPSELYEGFPVTMVEAFACGLPIIASRLGSMAEIVDDGRTGLLFEPGNAEDLAAKVEWAWFHPSEMEAMGREARIEYEKKYTPERNYERLMAIYRLAIARSL